MGLATGNPGELPAGMLDKLGDFLVKDPFVNSEKVDKLCAYLEKNGTAALRFDNNKKDGLERLFFEDLGD
jgi:hypothetical protein